LANQPMSTFCQLEDSVAASFIDLAVEIVLKQV
jgi:hypothetical protein